MLYIYVQSLYIYVQRFYILYKGCIYIERLYKCTNVVCMYKGCIYVQRLYICTKVVYMLIYLNPRFHFVLCGGGSSLQRRGKKPPGTSLYECTTAMGPHWDHSGTAGVIWEACCINPNVWKSCTINLKSISFIFPYFHKYFITSEAQSVQHATVNEYHKREVMETGKTYRDFKVGILCTEKLFQNFELYYHKYSNKSGI